MDKRQIAEVKEREEATKLSEWADHVEPRTIRWDRIRTPPE